MTAITLEALKAKQDEFASMIAKFEAQAPRLFNVPEIEIELQERA